MFTIDLSTPDANDLVFQSFSNPHGVRTTPIWPTFFFLRHLRHSYLTKYDRMIECAHEKQEHITTRPFVELRIVHFTIVAISESICHLNWSKSEVLGSCQAWEMKFAAEWHWKRATHVRTVLREWDSTWHNEQFNTANCGMASMASDTASDTAHLKGCSTFSSARRSPLNIGEWPLCIASLHRD